MSFIHQLFVCHMLVGLVQKVIIISRCSLKIPLGSCFAKVQPTGFLFSSLLMLHNAFFKFLCCQRFGSTSHTWCRIISHSGKRKVSTDMLGLLLLHTFSESRRLAIPPTYFRRLHTILLYHTTQDVPYEPVHVSHDHFVYKLLNRSPQILLNLCGSCKGNISMNISASRFARKCTFEF